MASLPAQPLLGIDVGGTKVAAALIDAETGSMARRLEIATGVERGPEAVVADIVALAETVAVGEPIAAIGVGLPELVDAEGAIRSAYLLDWQQGELQDRLAILAPVRFESDVRAAALAEATLGAGTPYDLFVYISLGTGISSTLVQHGEPLVGARGGALVLSTGPLGMPCGSCGVWRDFILEDFASGRALAERYATATNRTAGTISAHNVLTAASAGDSAAVTIVDSAAEALGSALGWLVNVLDPEALVIGGGLGLAPGRYHDQLLAATRAHIWNVAARHLPIVSAGLGSDAGVIGAALSARDHRQRRASLNVITRESASSLVG
jgi:glucokinase